LTSQRLVSDCGGLLQEPGLNRGCVSSQTILIVDDEAPLRQILRARLTVRGYSIQEASSGEEVLRTVPDMQPDVIILDIGLPGINGIEVTRRLRPSIQTPIIILSVHAAESDRIAALDAGADDYLTKPCDLGELLDRIRTVTRRATLEVAGVFTAGDLVVDVKRQTVHVANEPVQLTETEYNLLKVLVLNVGKLLTQGRLVKEIWGERIDDDARQLLRTTIRSLRQKLDADSSQPGHITTEPGVGYRLRLRPPE
jgi:two-component system, OmpR family, KDP operon response regulator KdpE